MNDIFRPTPRDAIRGLATKVKMPNLQRPTRVVDGTVKHDRTRDFKSINDLSPAMQVAFYSMMVPFAVSAAMSGAMPIANAVFDMMHGGSTGQHTDQGIHHQVGVGYAAGGDPPPGYGNGGVLSIKTQERPIELQLADAQKAVKHTVGTITDGVIDAISGVKEQIQVAEKQVGTLYNRVQKPDTQQQIVNTLQTAAQDAPKVALNVAAHVAASPLVALSSLRGCDPAEAAAPSTMLPPDGSQAEQAIQQPDVVFDTQFSDSNLLKRTDVKPYRDAMLDQVDDAVIAQFGAETASGFQVIVPVTQHTLDQSDKSISENQPVVPDGTVIIAKGEDVNRPGAIEYVAANGRYIAAKGPSTDLTYREDVTSQVAKGHYGPTVTTFEQGDPEASPERPNKQILLTELGVFFSDSHMPAEIADIPPNELLNQFTAEQQTALISFAETQLKKDLPQQPVTKITVYRERNSAGKIEYSVRVIREEKGQDFKLTDTSVIAVEQQELPPSSATPLPTDTPQPSETRQPTVDFAATEAVQQALHQQTLDAKSTSDAAYAAATAETKQTVQANNQQETRIAQAQPPPTEPPAIVAPTREATAVVLQKPAVLEDAQWDAMNPQQRETSVRVNKWYEALRSNNKIRGFSEQQMNELNHAFVQYLPYIGKTHDFNALKEKYGFKLTQAPVPIDNLLSNSLFKFLNHITFSTGGLTSTNFDPSFGDKYVTGMLLDMSMNGDYTQSNSQYAFAVLAAIKEAYTMNADSQRKDYGGPLNMDSPTVDRLGVLGLIAAYDDLRTAGFAEFQEGTEIDTRLHNTYLPFMNEANWP